jgi:hypothetical protein
MLVIKSPIERGCWQAILAAMKPALQGPWYGFRSEREAYLGTYRWIEYALSASEPAALRCPEDNPLVSPTRDIREFCA